MHASLGGRAGRAEADAQVRDGPREKQQHQRDQQHLSHVHERTVKMGKGPAVCDGLNPCPQPRIQDQPSVELLHTMQNQKDLRGRTR